MLDILTLVELAIIVILAVLNMKWRSDSTTLKLLIDMLLILKNYFEKNGKEDYVKVLEEVLWYIRFRIYDPDSLIEDVEKDINK